MSLMECSEAERIAILKHYDRTPETVSNDIEAIKQWMAKQPHLPEIPSDRIIEGFLLLNKFRVERVKERLDMYYSIRSYLPEFYDSDFSTLNVDEMLDHMYIFPLPKLTKDLNRVFIAKRKLEGIEKYKPELLCALFCNIYFEVRINEEYSYKDIQIHDLTGTTLANARRWSPMLLKKLVFIFEKMCSSSMKEVHFINAPTALYNIYNLIKSFLKPKIAQRIFIHEGMESLHSIVPKEILPKDFGGDEKSLEELNAIWKKQIQLYSPRIATLRHLRVNENLRQEKPMDTDLLGLQGNFRKLDID